MESENERNSRQNKENETMSSYRHTNRQNHKETETICSYGNRNRDRQKHKGTVWSRAKKVFYGFRYFCKETQMDGVA